MKNNAPYPCVVTNGKCVCSQRKQKLFLEFSQAKKTSTYSVNAALIHSEIFYASRNLVGVGLCFEVGL